MVKKHQRRLGKLEDQVISLYARGMSTRDICDQIDELYGVDLNASAVSQITDKLLGNIAEWQNRPLDSVYYPQEIRRLIYTTNAVEALHLQFRKVTKSKSVFPHDDALRKILYLAYHRLSYKWSSAVRDWPFVYTQLMLLYENRMPEFEIRV
jgi:transposase-like protein